MWREPLRVRPLENSKSFYRLKRQRLYSRQEVMKIRLTQDHPRYARLTKDRIVDAEPILDPPELMRVKGFGAFENGALVQGWELILPDEEIDALLNEG